MTIHRFSVKPPEVLPVTGGDINIYHARSIADQQVSYVLELSDKLNIDRLRSSLAILEEALPILSTVISVKGSHFQRTVLPDQHSILHVETECENAQSEIDQFISKPCNPECESPLKLLLISGRAQDSLCLKIDHTLSDAAGAKTLLYLLAEAYSSGKISGPINPDRGLGQVFRNFSPITLLKAATTANLPIPGSALISGPFPSTPIFIEHCTLEPVEFERMRMFAKQSGATINDVLLTALYRTIFERLKPDSLSPYPVMVPVDMRRYLSAQKRDIIGNLSSAVYPALSKIPGESFDQALARVKASMARFKQDRPGLGALVLMAISAIAGGRILRQRYQRAATRGSRFINFTNFGVIDEKQLQFDGAAIKRAYGVGPIQYAPGVLIALSTYQQTLHLVMQGNDTDYFQPFIRDFLNSIMCQLKSAH